MISDFQNLLGICFEKCDNLIADVSNSLSIECMRTVKPRQWLLEIGRITLWQINGCSIGGIKRERRRPRKFKELP